jgi:putative DNA primase/helicase
LRGGWTPEDAKHFVQCAAWAAGDEEWQQRADDVVPTTEQRLAARRDATGAPALRAMLGEPVVSRLTAWLGLGMHAAGAPTGLALAPLDALGDDPALNRVEGALRGVARNLRGVDALKCAVVREAAIDRLRQLGVKRPTAIVDAALKGRDHEEAAGQGQGLVLADVQPWPSQVEGAELLASIERNVRRFVVLPPEASAAIALWVLHAYAFDSFGVSPYLAVTSPTKQCGKTTLLIVLSSLVPRPLPSSNITPSSMFRVIESKRPTLLIDEADTFLKSSDELRGLLNAGHTKAMAFVLRTVGDEHEPRRFSVWAPKIIAKIGALPDTVASRSIIIAMRRRTKDEHVERLRDDQLGSLKILAQQAARWAKDHRRALGAVEPEAPETLNDRTADNWRPLFAIADLAGDGWFERAREAALALAGADAGDDDAVGVKLLRDVRDLFDQRREAAQQTGVRPRNVDRMSSVQLVETLGALAERPWSEFRRGKAITQAQLAKLLKGFGIASKSIRVDVSGGERVVRGYEREQFEEAFTRYLAEPVADRAGDEAGPVADDVAPAKAAKSVSLQARSTVALRGGRTMGRRIRLGA